MSSLYGMKAGMKLGSSFRVPDGSYSSFKSFDINFLNLPVYRADTKEEFAFDALMLLGSFTTGGTTGGFKFLSTKLKSD